MIFQTSLMLVHQIGAYPSGAHYSNYSKDTICYFALLTKSFSGANTLAYFAAASITKESMFVNTNSRLKFLRRSTTVKHISVNSPPGINREAHFAQFKLEPIEGSSEKKTFQRQQMKEEFRFRFRLGWFSSINKLIIIQLINIIIICGQSTVFSDSLCSGPSPGTRLTKNIRETRILSGII